MRKTTTILEAKGYDHKQIDSILYWGDDVNEPLDEKTRKEFGIHE